MKLVWGKKEKNSRKQNSRRLEILWRPTLRQLLGTDHNSWGPLTGAKDFSRKKLDFRFFFEKTGQKYIFREKKGVKVFRQL